MAKKNIKLQNRLYKTEGLKEIIPLQPRNKPCIRLIYNNDITMTLEYKDSTQRDWDYNKAVYDTFNDDNNSSRQEEENRKI